MHCHGNPHSSAYEQDSVIIPVFHMRQLKLRYAFMSLRKVTRSEIAESYGKFMFKLSRFLREEGNKMG